MKKKEQARDLFNVIEESKENEKPIDECSHLNEDKTFTVWPGENFDRMTWTCRRCGRIRGRC
jgi:hypothetical protein